MNHSRSFPAHEFPVRIYYEDTDFSGNVYHAAYLKFMERARSELLRSLGIHHSELAKTGVGLVVRHMEIWYDRPAHIDDALVVKTSVEEVRGARLHLVQTVLRGEEILVRAKVLVVGVGNKGRPVRLPTEISRGLGPT